MVWFMPFCGLTVCKGKATETTGDGNRTVPLWFKPKSVIRPFFEYLCLLSVL